MWLNKIHIFTAFHEVHRIKIKRVSGYKLLSWSYQHNLFHSDSLEGLCTRSCGLTRSKSQPFGEPLKDRRLRQQWSERAGCCFAILNDTIKSMFGGCILLVRKMWSDLLLEISSYPYPPSRHAYGQRWQNHTGCWVEDLKKTKIINSKMAKNTNLSAIESESKKTN